MNNLYKFFNYNFIKIIKENIKNNEKIKITKEEKKQLSKLILKKEICAIIFTLDLFFIKYASLIEIYKLKYNKNIPMFIIKDNFLPNIITFIIMSILPLITNIFIEKKIKSKKYLLLLFTYLISNVLNIMSTAYFILAMHNTILFGIIGIINAIITIIININIVIKIKENYLKK
jgi:hypothetical protein